jgi:hypothetical protein
VLGNPLREVRRTPSCRARFFTAQKTIENLWLGRFSASKPLTGDGCGGRLGHVFFFFALRYLKGILPHENYLRTKSRGSDERAQVREQSGYFR